MNKLDVIINDNCIDKDDLMNALHLDIREIILKAVINRMKADKVFFVSAKQNYFNFPNLDAARKIIKSVCGINISGEDLLWFDECIKAFFKKKDKRAVISQEMKLAIVSNQNKKCALCGTEISMSNMHVDHIIPWDYVGDELKGNLQGLCPDCNLHKSNHVAQAVARIILK